MMADAAHTTNRREFLAAMPAAAVAAAVPAAALAAPGHDLLADWAMQDLLVLFDAFDAAEQGLTSVFNQPRTVGDTVEVIAEEIDRATRGKERIAGIALAAAMPTDEDEARCRVDILKKWSASIDNPALDRRVAAEIIAYRDAFPGV